MAHLDLDAVIVAASIALPQVLLGEGNPALAWSPYQNPAKHL